MRPSEPPRRRGRRRRGPPPVRRLWLSAENALELVRLGRLSARQGSDYDVVHQSRHYRLRRYRDSAAGQRGPALLLVPPLMLTAEIYDVAPDISAVRVLLDQAIDVWVVDFGAPEREEGGMKRTLDDHVRSVADAVARVRDHTGRAVHLAGYSQGGMFVYQAAAYRRSDGVGSLITFGAPVDIHRNLPRVSTDVTARLIRAARPFVEPTLKRLEGLPGVLTSTGFKLFSLRKELQQIAEFFTLLYDRRALERRESRRRFLAGEGFVAWPGPALMKFIDDFVVHNRLLSGGFVIDGRTVTLADIRCPVLYFVGDRDEMARPPSVRALRDAVVDAELFEVELHAGHFGLVVGSTALRDTWPTVVEWLKWREEGGPRPRLLAPARGEDAAEEPLDVEDAAFDTDLDIELFYDVITRSVSSAWKKLGDAFEDAGDVLDQARYRVPRLIRLRQMDDETRVSMGRVLSQQAETHGERTYFLYEGRAVTYRDANRRIDAVVRGLIACAIRPGQFVGVLMNPRPSYLSVVCALNRLGAVAVLMKPEQDAEALRRAMGLGQVQALVADPEHAKVGARAFDGKVLVLGGAGKPRNLPESAVDMEAIDPEKVELPHWYRENPGRAEDLAMVIVTVEGARRRAARITNRRWAFSAYGAAAACTLTPKDTVYCCMPLHHPAGLLVSAGGASVGGARLALASRFEPNVFWSEVRRYGATVVFYANEMCRVLVDAPPSPGERRHPLRLFAGSGMRADVWRRLMDRFSVDVLEFYASTEVSLVLANTGGDKVGALGRPLPGSREPLLAAYDLGREKFVRDRRGHILEAATDQPGQSARRAATANETGVLLVRVEPTPLSPLDEAADEPRSLAPSPRLLRGVRGRDDPWYVTGDLMRRDEDGDYWLIDSLAGCIRTEEGLVPSRPIEDALYELDEVAGAVVYGIPAGDGATELVVAALVLRPGTLLDSRKLMEHLRARATVGALPAFLRLIDRIPMTGGFRPQKAALRSEGITADGKCLRYEPERGEYVVLGTEDAVTAGSTHRR